MKKLFTMLVILVVLCCTPAYARRNYNYGRHHGGHRGNNYISKDVRNASEIVNMSAYALTTLVNLGNMVRPAPAPAVVLPQPRVTPAPAVIAPAPIVAAPVPVVVHQPLRPVYRQPVRRGGYYRRPVYVRPVPCRR